jgi:hypothetical protein
MSVYKDPAQPIAVRLEAAGKAIVTRSRSSLLSASTST